MAKIVCIAVGRRLDWRAPRYIVVPHPRFFIHTWANSGEVALRVEYADLSLIGDREENQDRVLVVAGEKSVLLIAIDLSLIHI